jgi:outer membrane immunogenic protein
MRKLFVLFGFMLFVAASVKAQGFEVAGNYQFVRINPGGGAPGSNCQGVAGSAAVNLTNLIGVVGDFGGCKVTGLPTGNSGSQINYLFGPRLTYHGYGRFSPFAQTLLGGAHSSATATVPGFPSTSASANSFGWTLGGGADFALNQNFSFRAIQFEYFMTHFGGTRQNDFRIQSGIVYHFGSSKR